MSYKNVNQKPSNIEATAALFEQVMFESSFTYSDNHNHKMVDMSIATELKKEISGFKFEVAALHSKNKKVIN